MKSIFMQAGLFLLFLLIPVLALAAGEHGGGQGGCGDVFGDLIHIKRDAVTGQPILQKRWIEYPGDVLDWGYCPIPLNAAGEEIGFAPDSCDPLDPAAVVEVDYFGRLNGGRTKERNSRMRFDEVIENIQAARIIKQDETGRLKLGYDCTAGQAGNVSCSSWKIIDSPMENLALYTRLMKYGHLQTDPSEVDIWAHGDPAAGIQRHPALAPEDWGKFHQSVRHLLPRQECFFGSAFNPGCEAPEFLQSEDFVRAASFLAGAANKNGKITVDLVQYMNRILKITRNTETTSAAAATLPALIRDCGPEPLNQLPIDQCPVISAAAGLPAPADERFVDFGATGYLRSDWREENLEALLPAGDSLWQEETGVPLLGWLDFVNGPAPEQQSNIDGFTGASTDALRAIEFIHEYAIPADLEWAGF